jgi:hypothetical protein
MTDRGVMLYTHRLPIAGRSNLPSDRFSASRQPKRDPLLGVGVKRPVARTGR